MWSTYQVSKDELKSCIITFGQNIQGFCGPSQFLNRKKYVHIIITVRITQKVYIYNLQAIHTCFFTE